MEYWTIGALLIVSAILIGISKGGFGGALGGLSVPLLTLVLPPTQVVAVIMPILCIADFTGIKAYYGKWSRDNLKVMLPGAVLGMSLGVMTFGLFDDRWIGLAIGVISIVFSLMGFSVIAPVSLSEGGRPMRGRLLSALSGYTSFVSHSGGPPVLMYLIPQGMDKLRFIATCNVFFLFVNFVKLVAYGLLGMYTLTTFSMSLLVAPIVVAGVFLGGWLQGKVTPKFFYRIARAGMFITGVQLVARHLMV